MPGSGSGDSARRYGTTGRNNDIWASCGRVLTQLRHITPFTNPVSMADCIDATSELLDAYRFKRCGVETNVLKRQQNAFCGITDDIVRTNESAVVVTYDNIVDKFCRSRLIIADSGTPTPNWDTRQGAKYQNWWLKYTKITETNNNNTAVVQTPVFKYTTSFHIRNANRKTCQMAPSMHVSNGTQQRSNSNTAVQICTRHRKLASVDLHKTMAAPRSFSARNALSAHV